MAEFTEICTYVRASCNMCTVTYVRASCNMCTVGYGKLLKHPFYLCPLLFYNTHKTLFHKIAKTPMSYYNMHKTLFHKTNLSNVVLIVLDIIYNYFVKCGASHALCKCGASPCTVFSLSLTSFIILDIIYNYCQMWQQAMHFANVVHKPCTLFTLQAHFSTEISIFTQLCKLISQQKFPSSLMTQAVHFPSSLNFASFACGASHAFPFTLQAHFSTEISIFTQLCKLISQQKFPSSLMTLQAVHFPSSLNFLKQSFLNRKFPSSLHDSSRALCKLISQQKFPSSLCKLISQQNFSTVISQQKNSCMTDCSLTSFIIIVDVRLSWLTSWSLVVFLSHLEGFAKIHV